LYCKTQYDQAHSPGRTEAAARWRRSSFYLEDLPDLNELEGAGDDEPLLPPGLRPKDGNEE
jgi:hypothetical protein